MKYTELTQEQRDSITPWLIKMLRSQSFFRNMIKGILRGDTTWTIPEEKIRIILSNHDCQIKAYQQAQKAEIEFLENNSICYGGEFNNDERYVMSEYFEEKYNQLKFESELE